MKLVDAGRALKNTDVIIQLWEKDTGEKVVRITDFLEEGCDKFFTFDQNLSFEDVIKKFEERNAKND